MAKVRSRRGPCPYCGNRFARRGERMKTIDHVHPTSKGGSPGFENRVACCWRCNNDKMDLGLTKWLALLVERSDRRATHVARFIEARQTQKFAARQPFTQEYAISWGETPMPLSGERGTADA